MKKGAKDLENNEENENGKSLPVNNNYLDCT
jgi:hypothetical protein